MLNSYNHILISHTYVRVYSLFTKLTKTLLTKYPVINDPHLTTFLLKSSLPSAKFLYLMQEAYYLMHEAHYLTHEAHCLMHEAHDLTHEAHYLTHEAHCLIHEAQPNARGQ